MAWHRSRRADLGLRGTGLLLCWLSYAALARLMAMHAPPHSAGFAADRLRRGKRRQRDTVRRESPVRPDRGERPLACPAGRDLFLSHSL